MRFSFDIYQGGALILPLSPFLPSFPRSLQVRSSAGLTICETPCSTLLLPVATPAWIFSGLSQLTVTSSLTAEWWNVANAAWCPSKERTKVNKRGGADSPLGWKCRAHLHMTAYTSERVPLSPAAVGSATSPPTLPGTVVSERSSLLQETMEDG